MSDAARQAYNAKARREIATPENMCKAKARKARAEMSVAAKQAYNAKTRKIMALPENVREARERDGAKSERKDQQ